MNRPLKILAVDDNEDALFALERLLVEQGYEVVTATSGRAALDEVERSSPDIVLLDWQMPGELDGIAVTRELKSDELRRFIPVILLTAKDSIDDLLEGFEAGADDFIKKPFNPQELLARLKAFFRLRETYLQFEAVVQANHDLQRRIGERAAFPNIIGRSPRMREVFDIVSKIKDSAIPVLVHGESGTGKELIAQAIHEQSARRKYPFIAQNCAAFNDNLLESELFGHLRGSFTGAVRDKPGLFQSADKGTLFLDEIGEMSASLQAKLLRVLQDGTFTPVGDTRVRKVDVRVIGATHRNLPEMVKRGTFREDLFYRLNVVPLHLPPLRERGEDIPLLADHFLDRIASREAGRRRRLDADAMRCLVGFEWPGNVRQLQNEIERAVLLGGDGDVLNAHSLSPEVRGVGVGSSSFGGLKLKDALDRLERQMIEDALRRLSGNKSEAARELGISRSNLIAKVQAYGLGGEE